MKNSVEQDAAEFGRLELHVRQGGWRLGLLVARSVEKGAGKSKVPGKVSARSFASKADTTDRRILRYLGAWEKAAEAGHVPAASTLSPGEEVKLKVGKLPDWAEFYSTYDDTASTGTTSNSIEKATDEKLGRVIENLTPEAQKRVGRAIAAKAPAARKEIVYESMKRMKPEELTAVSRDAADLHPATAGNADVKLPDHRYGFTWEMSGPQGRLERALDEYVEAWEKNAPDATEEELQTHRDLVAPKLLRLRLTIEEVPVS